MPVDRYWEGKARLAALLVPMYPPGRLALLRRLKPGPGAGGGGRGQRGAALRQPPGGSGGGGGSASCCSGCGGACSGCRGGGGSGGSCCGGRGGGRGAGAEEAWDAVWVPRERLMEEGILLSPRQVCPAADVRCRRRGKGCACSCRRGRRG